MNLVPISSLGYRFGVDVCAMEAIIALGNIVHQTDYWRRGRTADRLGIAKLNDSELPAWVKEGVRYD